MLPEGRKRRRKTAVQSFEKKACCPKDVTTHTSFSTEGCCRLFELVTDDLLTVILSAEVCLAIGV